MNIRQYTICNWFYSIEG